MQEGCNLEHRFEALRKRLATEFQRTKQVAHKLIDDLTAISGYAEIMVMQGGQERAMLEFRKILERAKKSIVVLQDCIVNLYEVGRRYSRHVCASQSHESSAIAEQHAMSEELCSQQEKREDRQRELKPF